MSAESMESSSDPKDIESLWGVVKDLNRARHNKEALDLAIGEETALLDCLLRMEERLDEAIRSHRAPVDQVGALQLIDEATQEIVDATAALLQEERDCIGDLREAERATLSLRLQLQEIIGKSAVDEMVAPSVELQNDPVQLAEGVVRQRSSCLRCTKDMLALKQRVAELERETEALEEECVDLEKEMASVHERKKLLQENAHLEASIETLVKLVSIQPLHNAVHKR